MDFNGNREASLLDHLCQWFSNFSMCQNHMENQLKHRLLDPTPEFLGLSLRIFISKFPGDIAAAVVQGPHFENY